MCLSPTRFPLPFSRAFSRPALPLKGPVSGARFPEWKAASSWEAFDPSPQSPHSHVQLPLSSPRPSLCRGPWSQSPSCPCQPLQHLPSTESELRHLCMSGHLVRVSTWMLYRAPPGIPYSGKPLLCSSHWSLGQDSPCKSCRRLHPPTAARRALNSTSLSPTSREAMPGHSKACGAPGDKENHQRRPPHPRVGQGLLPAPTSVFSSSPGPE
nr:uncharacterized protein LOC105885110 [Microcebus murinus]